MWEGLRWASLSSHGPPSNPLNLTSSVRFEYDDPWLADFIKSFNDTLDAIGSGFISDFVPALKFFDRNKIQLMTSLMDRFYDLLGKEYAEHRANFDPSEFVLCVTTNNL